MSITLNLKRKVLPLIATKGQGVICAKPKQLFNFFPGLVLPLAHPAFLDATWAILSLNPSMYPLNTLMV